MDTLNDEITDAVSVWGDDEVVSNARFFSAYLDIRNAVSDIGDTTSVLDVMDLSVCNHRLQTYLSKDQVAEAVDVWRAAAASLAN